MSKQRKNMSGYSLKRNKAGTMSWMKDTPALPPKPSKLKTTISLNNYGFETSYLADILSFASEAEAMDHYENKTPEYTKFSFSHLDYGNDTITVIWENENNDIHTVTFDNTEVLNIHNKETRRSSHRKQYEMLCLHGNTGFLSENAKWDEKTKEIRYYKKGKLHNENGPAVIHENGNSYYENGKLIKYEEIVD